MKTIKQLRKNNILSILLYICAVPFLTAYVAIGYETGKEIDLLVYIAGWFIITATLLLKND